jgi:hypothetical protein
MTQDRALITGLVVIGLLVAIVAYQHKRLQELQRQIDSAGELDGLRDAGMIAPEPVSEKDWKAEYERALAKSKDLEDQLKKLQAEFDARPVRIVYLGTKPGPVTETPSPTAPECPGSPTCVVSAKDEMRVEADAVESVTEKGNYVFAGLARVIRMPDSVIYEQPFSADFSRVIQRPDPIIVEKGRGIGYGGWLHADPDGWMAGPSVALPSWKLPLVGGSLDVALGGGIGPREVEQEKKLRWGLSVQFHIRP